MSRRKKEVIFADWCPSCIHAEKQQNELPCNDCLAYGWNDDSHRPHFHKTEQDMETVLEDIAKKYATEAVLEVVFESREDENEQTTQESH